jgi:hypothetical protein
MQNYRYWVLWKCPSVRFLDFEKVKESEREKARELFGTEEEPTALASKVQTAPIIKQLHDANNDTDPGYQDHNLQHLD